MHVAHPVSPLRKNVAMVAECVAAPRLRLVTPAEARAGDPSVHESCTDRYNFRFRNNCFAEMRCGSEEGSYLRLVDFCITHL